MSRPGLEAALIPSGGQTLLGGLYLAGVPDPAPAVALLHGIPGHELNLDLAQSLRAAGLHVLYFHFRGSWGSAGTYRLDQLLDDALAAVDWLAGQPQVDPTRLGLVGFSLGGWVALAAASARPDIRATVALSPLLNPAARPLTDDEAEQFSLSLEATTARELQAGWDALLPFEQLAPALRGRPILLVTGDHDAFFPSEHYLSAPQIVPELEWVRFPRADHAFCDVRPGLTHLVRQWLMAHL